MKWFILNFIIIIIFNCLDTIQIMALQLGPPAGSLKNTFCQIEKKIHIIV